MKRYLLFALLALPLLAQAPAPAPDAPALPKEGIALGVAYSQRATEWGAYFRQVSGSTYWFTDGDLLRVSRHPLQAQVVTMTGICEITHQMKRVLLGMCGQAGLAQSSTESSNVGGAVDGYGLGAFRVDKKGKFYLVGTYGYVKTALSAGQRELRIGTTYTLR